MTEHRPILLPENICTNNYPQIVAYTEDIPVVRRVVELAESNAVWNGGLAERVPVGEDMAGFQELSMPQTAYGA